MKGNFDAVTREAFDAFIAAYPATLTRNVWGAGEPALVSFNDFTGGKVWPDSVVAWYHDGWHGPENWHITKSA